MSALELYLLIKLDAIICLFRWAFALCLFFPLLLTFIVFIKEPEGEEHEFKVVFKKYRYVLFLSALFIFPSFLLPSTKEMSIIYVVPKVINNKAVSEIPGKLLRLSSEWIDELRPENIKDGVKTIVQQPQPKTAEAD